MRGFTLRLAAASFLPISTASAQFGTIEKLVDSFTDVSLTVSWGALGPRARNVQSHHGFFSYGAEFAFQVAEATRPICLAGEDPREKECYAPKDRKANGRATWLQHRKRFRFVSERMEGIPPSFTK